MLHTGSPISDFNTESFFASLNGASSVFQICVWDSDSWERQQSRFLPIPGGKTSAALSDTRVQFHQDQTHFLVVHETQLAIYEIMKLECMKQVSSSPSRTGPMFSEFGL